MNNKISLFNYLIIFIGLLAFTSQALGQQMILHASDANAFGSPVYDAKEEFGPKKTDSANQQSTLSFSHSDWVMFADIDLTGIGYLNIRYKPLLNQPFEIWLYADAQYGMQGNKGRGMFRNGEKIGALTVSNTTDTLFRTDKIFINKIKPGKHQLFLILVGSDKEPNEYMHLNYLQKVASPSTDCGIEKLLVSGLSVPFKGLKSGQNEYEFYVSPEAASLSILAQPRDDDATLFLNNKKLATNTVHEVILTKARQQLIKLDIKSASGKKRNTYTFKIRHYIPRQEMYVSTTGDDAGDGSSKAPWKSLEYAVSHTMENTGQAILLDSGTHIVNNPIILPSGLKLIGKGMKETVVRYTDNAPVLGSGDSYAINRFMLQMYNANGNEISGFTMDGKLNDSKLATGGIYINGSSNASVNHVQVSNFNHAGIWVEDVDSFSLYNSKILYCGWGNKSSCNGGIQLGHVSNSIFHDIMIREDRGNDGLRTMKSSWPVNIYKQHPDNTPLISHTKFYNIDIELRENGAWGNGQPNEDIAFWNAYVENVELYNCRFREKFANQGSPLHKGQPGIRVHHNEFKAKPWGKNYTYHMEFDADFSQIDHNLFINGIYPIASFEHKHPRQNVVVTKNIFVNTEGIDIIHMNGGISGWLFENNIVALGSNLKPQWQGKFPLMMAGPKDNIIAKKINIKNNIFISELYPNNIPLFTQGAKQHIDTNIHHNFFYNWQPDGKSHQTANPHFSWDDYRFQAPDSLLKMSIEPADAMRMGLNENYFFANQADTIERVWLVLDARDYKTGGYEMLEGQTGQLGFKGRTVNGFLLDVYNKPVTYSIISSNNSGGLHINEDGKVRAIKKGIYKIIGTVKTDMGIKTSSALVVVR